jgi:hypothetical protein
MADDATNLVLKHLRAIRSDVHEQREHGHRLSRLEIGVAALRRDQASDAENTIERIERRLEILD